MRTLQESPVILLPATLSQGWKLPIVAAPRTQVIPSAAVSLQLFPPTLPPQTPSTTTTITTSSAVQGETIHSPWQTYAHHPRCPTQMGRTGWHQQLQLWATERRKSQQSPPTRQLLRLRKRQVTVYQISWLVRLWKLQTKTRTRWRRKRRRSMESSISVRLWRRTNQRVGSRRSQVLKALRPVITAWMR